MISADTEQLLDQLYNQQSLYRPDPTITTQLASKTIVMVVGATCVGKNTVMDAVATVDERFGIAGTFTSRPPRGSDNPEKYTYYDNTDAGLAPLLQQITERQVVQYAVNPFAKLIYGSVPNDYAQAFTIADVFSSAVENFRDLGFKRAIAITIVTDPDVWLQRFNIRFPIGNIQRQARRDEAIESFAWSLAQTEKYHFWIENIDGKPELAAHEIITISLGKSTGQANARELASACLKLAKTILL